MYIYKLYLKVLYVTQKLTPDTKVWTVSHRGLFESLHGKYGRNHLGYHSKSYLIRISLIHVFVIHMHEYLQFNYTDVLLYVYLLCVH